MRAALARGCGSGASAWQRGALDPEGTGWPLAAGTRTTSAPSRRLQPDQYRDDPALTGY